MFNTILTLMKQNKPPSADQSTEQGTVCTAVCCLMRNDCQVINTVMPQ